LSHCCSIDTAKAFASRRKGRGRLIYSRDSILDLEEEEEEEEEQQQQQQQEQEGFIGYVGGGG